jgi:hypothetical protein
VTFIFEKCVNVPTKSNKQTNIEKKYLFVGVLKVNDGNISVRIRIRTHTKCHGSAASVHSPSHLMQPVFFFSLLFSLALLSASFLDPHGTAFFCVDIRNRQEFRKAYVFELKTPSSSLALKSFKYCRDEYLTRNGNLTFDKGPLTGIILQ